MPRRWQRRGARSTGNLSLNELRAELAELRALVAARRRRERDGAAEAKPDVEALIT
jgi:hypothetical protein